MIKISKTLFVFFITLSIFTFSFNSKKLYVPFIYQLTDINLNKITNYYTPKFLVIDYSKDGSDEKKFTYTEIKTLKTLNIKPLAYLSIGEAEDYRYYWKNSWYDDLPDWIDNENPRWTGNYKVKYWDKSWKKIIFNYLDKIISQGFSGVYLDIIDGYYYFSEKGYNTEKIAHEMIKFVIEIAEYARKKNKNFLIVPQNGESILKYDYNNKYLNTISGLGVEDLFYYKTNKNSKKYVESRLNYILKIKNSGKFILVTDYVYNPISPNKNIILNFINLCKKYNFLGYPANINQELNNISNALKYYK
ncbi:hypothetical protein OSSY52_15430 [Tepiditoga spiralis]|uniref:Glycoside-hydrolase family GH114 TIM-barrel domain-containing protein n=1 Tax=Tepiditoga spiralis TaxID=2108365 RepID=A0A7G1GAW6_9BACT|nr:MJ1477/TM1410 family putative glycoside hydrolase [Tepiditoga spiralis]BBE31402.1 hypothetical protein OSSY52_15430 [Tepiditoga spiralis]